MLAPENILPDSPAERLDVLKAALIYDAEAQRDDYLAFQTRCVRAFGPAAGPYLRQLVYWTGRSVLEDGWLWKTEVEMEAETGLSRTHQRRARKILKSAGVLEEKRKGVPYRLHFRVDLTKLSEILEPGTSTLNQWRRGMRKDPKTGRFYHPDGETLNPSYREDGNTVPTREDRIPSEPEGTVDGPDQGEPYTDRSIQRVRPESSAGENEPGTPLLQSGADGPPSRPAPPSGMPEAEELSGAKPATGASPSQQASWSDREKLDPGLIAEIRDYLSEASEDNEAARLFAEHRDSFGAMDVMDVLHAIARAFYPGYLSEDLRQHATAAIDEELALDRPTDRGRLASA